MGARLEQAKLETIRAEFLGGTSLRALAGRHEVSLRSLATYSKRGGWDGQRQLQQLATNVPALVKAADARVEVMASHWRSRIGSILDTTTEVAAAVAEKLRSADLAGLDGRELCAMLKLLIDSMDRLAVYAPEDRRRSLPVVSMRLFKADGDDPKKGRSADGR